MPRILTLSDGRLSATASVLLNGSDAVGAGGRVAVACQNLSEDIIRVSLVVSRANGTARQMAAIDIPSEGMWYVDGLLLQPDDTLRGSASRGDDVDYLVTAGSSKPRRVCLDSRGNPRRRSRSSA